MGKIGEILQNKVFANVAQDIEFAIDLNNQIAILQSRNITNLKQETIWELEHEFDSALFCENDVLTGANIG